MRQDRIKWNQKYKEKQYPQEPAQIVRDYFSLANSGKALDIAAGNGRHSLFLAERGFSVDAVDISDVGLAEFAGRHPNMHAICADLDTFEIPQNRYDLIVNVKYLNRRMFPDIYEGLGTGGVLIFESLLETEDDTAHQTTCRDYLLRKNELLHAFLSLRILYYREVKKTEQNETSQVASLVGVKTSSSQGEF
jgi:SAM-dependent methyltransferase